MTGALAGPRRPTPRRSLVLCLAGALLGLMIGLVVVARNGGFGAPLPTEDAATVNGVPILMSDLQSEVETDYPKAAGTLPAAARRRVLDGMVADELRVQHGLEIGGARRNGVVRAALVQATEGQMVADAMATVPTQAELRRWYDEHRADYADPGYMKVREYILLPRDGAKAARIAMALRAGRPAASLGLRESGRLQGDDELYFAAKIHLGPRLFAIAERMGAGQVSDPIPLPDGIHILAMVYNHGPRPYGFDVAAAKVRSDLMTDKTSRLQLASGRYLRRRAEIRIAEALQ